MPQLLAVLLRWDVIGVLATFLISTGFALDPLNHFRAAKTCFVLSGAILVAKVVAWGASASPLDASVAVWLVVANAAIVAGVASALWVVHRLELRVSTGLFRETPRCPLLPQG